MPQHPAPSKTASTEVPSPEVKFTENLQGQPVPAHPVPTRTTSTEVPSPESKFTENLQGLPMPKIPAQTRQPAQKCPVLKPSSQRTCRDGQCQSTQPRPRRHKGEQQLQAHSEQLTCAGSHKSPAPMQAATPSSSCKLTAGSKHVLAHTRAQHPCKPQRQATAASTQQATNMRRLTQEPNPTQATKASNSSKLTASS